ncbi:hypothetical protein ACOSQ3_013695 [Xanthoceras sorbifolium]
MQVHEQVNGKYVGALLDVGADSNCLAQHIADRLLKLRVGFGTWRGQCMINVIPLDNFEMVLGIEFFVKAKVTGMPYLRGILNRDGDHPCFIKAMEILNKQGREAKSVGWVAELQSSMASCSGPVEFQRKLVNCSKLGLGPK